MIMSKKYYIAIGGKTIGPMNAASIKALQPDKDDLVWYEGLESWTKIRYIEELADCIASANSVSVPPPLPSVAPPPLLDSRNSQKYENHTPRQSGKHRDWVKITIIAALTVVAVTAIITAGNLIADKRLRTQLDLQSQRAEQYKREQAEAEYQHQLEAERQEAERQRQAAEAERQLRQHIEQLHIERKQLESSISECGRRLKKVQEFHFLRLSSEKEYEIKQIIDERNRYMSRMAAIDAELASYDFTQK